jgi:hypothetical protein
MKGSRNICVVIALAMTPTLAIAAPPAPTAAVRVACTPDAKRLCGKVIGNPEARRKCMIQHRAQFSDACKAAIAESHNAAPPTDTAAPVEVAPAATAVPSAETAAPTPSAPAK